MNDQDKPGQHKEQEKQVEVANGALTIRIERKHPLAIRWMHWMNFPLIATMIWSGWLIYWNDSIPLVGQAHYIYRVGLGKFTLFRFFPEWFYTAIHAHYNVTKGLGFHFFFMWLFVGNGILYVLYTVFSGEWRFLLPSRHSFREALEVSEDETYGMGLETDSTYGIDVVHHGGSLAGYKSDLFVIPSAGIGAVVLTNSDNGQSLLLPFMRRLLELLYDGKAEAESQVAASAKSIHASVLKDGEKVAVTPDSVAVQALASEYSNPDLGTIRVMRTAGGVTFAFRTFDSAMGTEKNDDGTTSFVILDPTLLFMPFVVGEQSGKRALTLHDNQHDFVFLEK